MKPLNSLKNKNRSISAVYKSISGFISVIGLTFILLTFFLCSYFIVIQVQQQRAKLENWIINFNRIILFLEDSDIFSLATDISPAASSTKFIVNPAGEITATSNIELIGLNIAPSAFFRNLQVLERNEYHIGIYPDFQTGMQNVYFAKKYEHSFICRNYTPERFFPGNKTDNGIVTISKDGLIIYSNEKEWIGDGIEEKFLYFHNSRIFISSSKTIESLPSSEIGFYQDVTSFFWVLSIIVVLTISAGIGIIWRNIRVKREFNSLQFEQSRLSEMSLSFSVQMESFPENELSFSILKKQLDKFAFEVNTFMPSFQETAQILNLLNQLILQLSSLLQKINEKTTEREIVQQQLIKSQETAINEKNILLKEVHHRVKNNLQVISSLLALQGMHVNNENFNNMVTDVTNRIISMSLVHEMIYSEGEFSNLNPKHYIEELSRHLIKSFDLHNVEIILDIDDVELSLKEMIPLGLVINELVTNSIKHVFLKQPEKGQIIIKIQNHKNGIYFTYSDTGSASIDNIDNIDSFGMELIKTLAVQLGGKLEISNIQGSLQFEIFIVQAAANRLSKI